MDPAELSIEGAGIFLVAVIMIGVFASAYRKRRLVVGISIGMAAAVMVIPFVAYFVARATNHLATTIDLTPPLYVVVTALACAALVGIGLLGGLIAELRPHPPDPDPDVMPPAKDELVDDVTRWLPWKS